MMGLFKRRAGGGLAPPGSSSALAALGDSLVALPVPDGTPVPAQAFAVVCDGAGRLRRLEAGIRIHLREGERALCAHPGPYRIEVAPFAAAPELGLGLMLAVDLADPRVAQARFDLYLAAEVAQELTVAELATGIEHALRHELALGNLDLPPCTALDEWHAFRSGFDRLLYTRFGLTVDDCLPIDLGGRVDYAAMLRARALAPPIGLTDSPAAPVSPVVLDPGVLDRQALRRLFLELPGLMAALRMVTPAPGAFCLQRALLQRFDLASLQASAMPALELAGPGQQLVRVEQARRAEASVRAAATLDEAWGWLARVQGDCSAALFDECERIAANLEAALAERRSVTGDAA